MCNHWLSIYGGWRHHYHVSPYEWWHVSLKSAPTGPPKTLKLSDTCPRITMSSFILPHGGERKDPLDLGFFMKFLCKLISASPNTFTLDRKIDNSQGFLDGSPSDHQYAISWTSSICPMHHTATWRREKGHHSFLLFHAFPLLIGFCPS